MSGARLARQEKGKSNQERLSKKNQIDQAILSKIETGKHLPRFDTLERTAGGLNIPISQLLGVER